MSRSRATPQREILRRIPASSIQVSGPSSNGSDPFEKVGGLERIGRFLSVDPALESASPLSPQTWNRYTYAVGNPVKFIDPDGEAVQAVVALAVLEAGLTIVDAYQTVRTLADPQASAAEKGSTLGLAIIGMGAPGGGYTLADDLVEQGAKRLDSLARRVDNAFADHLTPSDAAAAGMEAAGEVVKPKPDGTPFDHAGEVRKTSAGVVRDLITLKNMAADGRLSATVRARAQRLLSEYSRRLDEVQQRVEKYRRKTLEKKKTADKG